MARKLRGRALNGILLLDKPQGGSSNGVMQRARRLFDARKAGHTGALDPLATGMLPICFGEATKFSQYLLDADKRYFVVAKLGVITDTGDAEGEVLEQHPVQVTADQVQQVLHGFVGDISQVPPMYSALKVNGQPLYKLARQGIEIERKARPVTIYSIDFHGLAGHEVSFTVHCSKGTYVRTLVEDLGSALGCGGHVTVLRRLTVGKFKEPEMVTFEQLEALLGDQPDSENYQKIDELLLPLSTAVADWPTAELGDDAAFYVLQGQAVRPNRVSGESDNAMVQIIKASSGEFLGVGEIQDDGRVAPRRLIAE